MTALLFILWIVEALVAYGVLWLIQIPLRKKESRIPRIIAFVVKAFLLTLTAYLSIVVDNWFTWRTGYLLGSVYVALGGDLLGDIVSFVVRLIRKKNVSSVFRAIAGLVLTIAFLIYGTVNMQTVTANEITYRSDLLKRQHRFVFIADLHIGSAQSFDVIQQTIFDMVTSKHPDFIVLGGDITDEFTTKEEMETLYSMFGATGVPVYFVYGNHDRQDKAYIAGGATYTQAELEATMANYGITILKDSWVKISDDLVLLGREDITHSERLAVSDIPALPENFYVVSVDHSPYQTDDIIALGADLQLSGHSHAGQLFPLRFLCWVTGLDAKGAYTYGDAQMYVSSGFAGWHFPFRTESGCHYELVTLLPTSYK